MGVKNIKIVGISMLLTCLSLFVSGQSQHHVEKGETLYGISKQYHISVEQLKEANPFLNNRGLEEKDLLKIPLITTTDSVEVDSTLILHEVIKGETLYGISKKYNTTVDKLIELNSFLEEGLKIGQIIQIPLKSKKVKPKALNPVQGYTFRKVQPGETIYGISKKYGISEEEFLRANPQIVGQVLRLGDLIQVPMTEEEKEKTAEAITEVGEKIKEEEEEAQVEREKEVEEKGLPIFEIEPLPKDPKLQVYQIQEGDSFELVAEKFNVSKDWIEKFNPDVIDGLEPGNYLVIPLKRKINISLPLVADSLIDSNQVLPFKEVKIALVLPFSLNYLDSVYQSGEKPSEFDVMALEFYAGFKIAVDSLSKEGHTISVEVYDSEKNQNLVKSELATKIRKSSPDLVIGPLYSKNAQVLANELAKDSIMVVSPLSKKLQNQKLPNLVNCISQEEAEISGIAKYLNSADSASQIILVHIDNPANRNKVRQLKARILPQVYSIKEVWLSSELPNSGYFNKYLNKEVVNRFVSVDENQSLLATLIGQLHSMAKDSVQLISNSEIMSMKTIDYKYLNQSRFVCTNHFFIDYDFIDTKVFLNKYRRETNTDPSKFSISGFDVAYYFISTISKRPLSWEKHHGLGFNFEWNSKSPHVNHGVHVLNLKNYQFKEVVK